MRLRTTSSWLKGLYRNRRYNSSGSSEVLVYEGTFSKKVRLLRRVSLTSTICSAIFMPLALTIQSDVIPFAGQVAVASTVFVASSSSTAMLGLVTFPYVAMLYEHEQPPLQDRDHDQDRKDEKESAKERTFTAVRYNIFGSQVRSTFRLAQVDKGACKNPFASFAVRGQGEFYVEGRGLSEERLRSALSKQ
eukprot:gene30846-41036_t